jgi:branched-subunit amino acid aminotransferase/4-amino-4-deoxychorismate lyase
LKEKNFGRAELLSADEIFLCNSVRGLVRAEVVFDWLEEI